MNDPIEILKNEPVPLERLRQRLMSEGQAEGIVDAVYCHVDSPLGELFLAATRLGVVRLGFSHETDAPDLVARDVGPRVLEAPSRPAVHTPAPDSPLAVLGNARIELAEYFAGMRRAFDVPIDLRMTGFRAEVVTALAGIEYGQRRSYKELAAALGNPGATRAVGSACANNPIPIFLPCHRVVRSDGTWGNYRGGPDAKTYLLELEAA